MKIYKNGVDVVINGKSYDPNILDARFDGNTHIKVTEKGTGRIIVGKIKYENIQKYDNSFYLDQSTFLSDMKDAFGLTQPSLPLGGGDGDVLTKVGESDGSADWETPPAPPVGQPIVTFPSALAVGDRNIVTYVAGDEDEVLVIYSCIAIETPDTGVTLNATWPDWNNNFNAYTLGFAVQAPISSPFQTITIQLKAGGTLQFPTTGGADNYSAVVGIQKIN